MSRSLIFLKIDKLSNYPIGLSPMEYLVILETIRRRNIFNVSFFLDGGGHQIFEIFRAWNRKAPTRVARSSNARRTFANKHAILLIPERFTLPRASPNRSFIRYSESAFFEPVKASSLPFSFNHHSQSKEEGRASAAFLLVPLFTEMELTIAQNLNFKLAN